MSKAPKMPKEDKLYSNLLKVARQYMMGKSFAPTAIDELMDKLSLPLQHKPILQRALKTLIEDGDVTLLKEEYQWKKSQEAVVPGTIRMHHRGFGFVELDDAAAFAEDVFIPKHLTYNAVDGDRVEVVINTESISEKGPEGKVVNILERGRTHIAGIIRVKEKHGDIVAYVPLLGLTQRVVVDPAGKKDLNVGDRIVMEVIDWGSKETETACRYSQYLGHISDHTCDIKASIQEYELRNEFPPAVVEEAQGFGKTVSKSDMATRDDFRQLECFTIDPDTAKDFDDALTLTIDSAGNYHLGVHIADVTHYVKPGSPLDIEAKERANSTYFPGFCLPMLPKELSNNLCSLKANVNRLTASVMMTIDQEGELIDYRISRSVIKSQKRFTYREAKLVIDGTKKSKHADTLMHMVDLCGLLKKKRFQRGSLDLALPELMVVVDPEGLPTGTEYIEYDITHQLVEEFMLKANEVIAKHLTDHDKPLAYRVHETPSSENIKDFVALARAFGFELPDQPTPEDLQALFYESLETPYGQHLAASYIKRMRMAVYSPENIGHYGLSLEHYCHFTSPIRRYADVVVHRVLFGNEMSIDELEKITLHCSEQERISAKAESSVVLLKKLRLIQAIHDKDPHQEYAAVVTNIRAWGINIDILDYMMDSFIHILLLPYSGPG